MSMWNNFHTDTNYYTFAAYTIYLYKMIFTLYKWTNCNWQKKCLNAVFNIKFTTKTAKQFYFFLSLYVGLLIYHDNTGITTPCTLYTYIFLKTSFFVIKHEPITPSWYMNNNTSFLPSKKNALIHVNLVTLN